MLKFSQRDGFNCQEIGISLFYQVTSRVPGPEWWLSGIRIEIPDGGALYEQHAANSSLPIPASVQV